MILIDEDAGISIQPRFCIGGGRTMSGVIQADPAGQVKRPGLLRRYAPIGSLVSLGLSIGALVLLVIAASVPWPDSWLYTLVALYGIFSVCWSVLRYWTGGLRRPIAGLLGGGLVVIGAAVLLAYEIHGSWDALFIIGSALIFAGLGWVVEWLRRLRKVPSSGKWLLLGGAVLLVVTVNLLAHVSQHAYQPVAILFGVAALLAIPVGLNLASEAALRRVEGSNSSVLPKTSVAAGAVLVILVVVAIGVVAHSWKAALIAAAVALILTAAIVSDSHLDVAIVIGVICLLAAAPPSRPAPPTISQGPQIPPDPGPATLIALGDSYMSGEGARTFYAGTDTPGEDECRRSPTAYAPRAIDGKRFSSLVFLACSGARSYNVILTPDRTSSHNQHGEPGTQLDILKRLITGKFTPTLAIIAIGGNDAGFSTVGEACLAPGDCSNPKLSGQFYGNLQAVRTALDATFASVQQVLPHVPVVAVPYPQPIFDGACNGLPLTPSERGFVKTFIDRLDDVIQAEALKAHLYYMDTMKSALADGHVQLCDPANGGHPGIYPIALKGVNGLATQRFNPATWLHNSLHPNVIGHAKMLAAFQLWLDRHPINTLIGPGAPSASAPLGNAAVDAAAHPDPQCSFTTLGPSNCASEARKFEISQVVHLWPWGIVILIGLAGCWLCAVGLLGPLSRRTPRRRATRGGASPVLPTSRGAAGAT